MAAKFDKKAALGTHFCQKKRIYIDFGVPGVSLGEALGRISGDKFKGAKNDEKKVGKLVASAGDADPGQDPPAGFLKAGFDTPSLPRGPVGGRIVYASRIPPRP